MTNTKQVKKYLGSWDTSAYDDLSKASRQTYETNWEDLKNRFASLIEQQDARQQAASRAYANTLANQTSDTFNTQRAIDQNLLNRGVANSGIRNLLTQEQTQGLGGNVNNALSKLMDTTSATMSARTAGLNDLITGGNKLNAGQLADQLNILGEKQAADMEGQQLAAQLAEADAARAARGGSGSNKADEEYNEEVRRLAVYSILNNIDPSTGEVLDVNDATKAYILGNVYDVKDAPNVIKLYDNRSQGLEGLNSLQKEYDKAKDHLQKGGYTDKRWDDAADLNEQLNTMRSIYNMPLNEYFKTIYAKR